MISQTVEKEKKTIMRMLLFKTILMLSPMVMLRKKMPSSNKTMMTRIKTKMRMKTTTKISKKIRERSKKMPTTKMKTMTRILFSNKKARVTMMKVKKDKGSLKKKIRRKIKKMTKRTNKRKPKRSKMSNKKKAKERKKRSEMEKIFSGYEIIKQ